MTVNQAGQDYATNVRPSRKYIRLILAYMTMVITSCSLLLKKQAAYSDYLVNFQRASLGLYGQFSPRVNNHDGPDAPSPNAAIRAARICLTFSQAALRLLRFLGYG